MTAGSLVRRCRRGFAASMIRPLRLRVMPKARMSPCRTQSCTRSIRLAPRFWPTKLVMAAPSALLTAQKTPSILEVMAQEATTTVPRELTPIWTIILETPYMAFWSPEGIPRRNMLLR